jgi:hypothetical protein
MWLWKDCVDVLRESPCMFLTMMAAVMLFRGGIVRGGDMGR